MSAPNRHPKYYFQDGNAIFQLDDQLFRLHQSFLCREGWIFNDLIDGADTDYPAVHDYSGFATISSPRGSTDSNPIILPGTNASIFAKLIQVVYVHVFDESARIYNWDPVEYAHVFLLADQFGMISVVETLARTIMALTALDSDLSTLYLGLAITYHRSFTDQFRDRLVEDVVKKNRPLTEDEADKLGARVTARIGAQRERLAQKDRWVSGWTREIPQQMTINDLLPRLAPAPE